VHTRGPVRGEREGAKGVEAATPATAAGVKPNLSWALRRIHKLFDLDGNGDATVEELLNFSRVTDLDISRRKSDRIIHGIDNNGDQKVSWDEYWDSRFGGAILSPDELELEKAKFDAIDQDGDGYLSINEVPLTLFPEQNPEVLKKIGEIVIAHKDKDRDGKLTASEMGIPEEDGHKISHFSNHDINGDDALDIREVLVWETGMLQSEANLQYLFLLADTNRDGNVNADEFGGLSHAEVEEYGNLDQLRTWALHYDL